jgi:hypothetical protein
MQKLLNLLFELRHLRFEGGNLLAQPGRPHLSHIRVLPVSRVYFGKVTFDALVICFTRFSSLARVKLRSCAFPALNLL